MRGERGCGILENAPPPGPLHKEGEMREERECKILEKNEMPYDSPSFGGGRGEVKKMKYEQRLQKKLSFHSLLRRLSLLRRYDVGFGSYSLALGRRR